MLSVTDTALDFLVLQLVLHALGVGVVRLVLGILAPVYAGSEDDVLSDRGGIGGRSIAVLCALSKFTPFFPIGYTGVHCLGVGDESNASGSLYFLAVIVVAECDSGLGAVLVGDGLGGREIGGLFDIVVVGPVVPVLMMVGLMQFCANG